MRGPPGCGKSTAARALLAQHLQAHGVLGGAAAKGASLGPHLPLVRAFILSTDDFFTSVDAAGQARYDFNPKALGKNHERNQARCEMAMELGITPLLVDNTNAALWEMRSYVGLAKRLDYEVRIVDPRSLSEDALNVDILEARCTGDDRAQGKTLGRHVLERIVGNFEELPEAKALRSSKVPLASDQALQAILDAQAPWERRGPPAPPAALYAGLDVEPKALPAVGGVELGPHFWGELGESGNYFEARALEDPGRAFGPDGAAKGPFQLPARLHVTARFFGQKPDQELLAVAKQLQDSRFAVVAKRLIFLRGGGLLCVDVDVNAGGSGKDSELQGLAPEGWRPHITLLTARGSGWYAKDSTAVLDAWYAAESLRRSRGSAAPSQADSQADSVPDTAAEDAADAHELRDSAVTAPDIGSTQLDSQVPEATWTVDGNVAICAGVQVLDRTVDLCGIELDPPVPLGLCPFRLFWR